MGRTLNRIKNKKYPAIPRTLGKMREVLNQKENLSKYGNTSDQKNKFYINTINSSAHTFMIFASFKTIEMIKRYIQPGQRRYLFDGTFKIRPKLFYQLLIITIEYKNDVNIFILRILTTNKSFSRSKFHHSNIYL